MLYIALTLLLWELLMIALLLVVYIWQFIVVLLPASAFVRSAHVRLMCDVRLFILLVLLMLPLLLILLWFILTVFLLDELLILVFVVVLLFTNSLRCYNCCCCICLASFTNAIGSTGRGTGSFAMVAPWVRYSVSNHAGSETGQMPWATSRSKNTWWKFVNDETDVSRK